MFSSKCKFLLDENVRHELYQFLNEKGVDVVKVPKGIKNGKVAQLSLKEERILTPSINNNPLLRDFLFSK
ncbi:MAG TPA: hypothetical protein DEP11_03815 [Candidatus Jacksonbacteria bacterium]|nr:hypothetical protein [Candidatus Jacksonbacteria bacterium]